MKNRNNYIDIIKFVFAVLVVIFHASSRLGGLFPGGRIAVEGFFMISGYLMMNSIRRQEISAAAAPSSLGKDTITFLIHKWKNLFPYLLPSALLSCFLNTAIMERDCSGFLKGLLLIFFEVFPLYTEGFRGNYYIGISWYISAMFLALAVLYPFCRRYGKNFVLTVCLPASLMIYGFLSHYIGSIATIGWMEQYPVQTGALRGFAGCMFGCLVYEAAELFSNTELTAEGRLLVGLAEFFCYFIFFYLIQNKPKSKYDYLLIFIIFTFLIIGISGHSFVPRFLKFRSTKALGTISTLIVLNHFAYTIYVDHLNGNDPAGPRFALNYCIYVAGASVITWSASVGINKIMSALPDIMLKKTK